MKYCIICKNYRLAIWLFNELLELLSFDGSIQKCEIKKHPLTIKSDLIEIVLLSETDYIMKTKGWHCKFISMGKIEEWLLDSGCFADLLDRILAI